MLVFVGLGLDNEKDMSLKGLEIVRECNKIYLESYTQPMVNFNIENFKKLIEKDIILLKREDLELNIEKIVKESKEKNICILVGGDPFVATTHNVFIPECIKENVDFKVIHSSSIFTAVCKSGLEIYKFGETVTIPFHHDHVNSFVVRIKRNLENGLHTLVLLDLDKINNKYFDVKEALKILYDRVDKNFGVFVFSRLGSEDEKITSGKINELLNLDLGNPPFCIVIPGKMNIIEKECFEAYKPKI